MPSLSDDPDIRAGQQKCLADVRDHGLHVLRVLGDAEWPEFAYSVGLYHNFEHPEVIILGLPGERAHQILNLIASDARAGTRYAAGDVSLELVEGYPVTFRAVPPAHVEAHFGWACWFYDGGGFPALQLIYPDKASRWPWDPAASDAFRAWQPVLETVAVPSWARPVD